MLKGEEFVSEYIDRNFINYVQTPQIFRYSILLSSMIKAAENNFIGTDESMLVKKAGYEVKIVESSIINFKITTPDDVELFKSIVKN